MPQRADTWLVTVNVAGRNLGIWDTLSGPETDSEESRFRPGGMNDEVSLGGRQTLGNAVLSRLHDEWLATQTKWLRSQCGMARGTIGRVPLNAFKQQAGPPEYYGGTLKRVSPPDHDSMGGDAAMVEIELTIDSVA